MSLPPTVRFDYDFQPEKNSDEEKIQEVFLSPKKWIEETSKEEKNAWAQKTNTC